MKSGLRLAALSKSRLCKLTSLPCCLNQVLCALCRTDCGVSTFVHMRPLLVSNIERYMAKREQVG